MNISALQYVDFDGSSLSPNHALLLNVSREVDITLLNDDDDEADKTFAVAMWGPNVGDGIKSVDITIIDNERTYRKIIICICIEMEIMPIQTFIFHYAIYLPFIPHRIQFVSWSQIDTYCIASTYVQFQSTLIRES